MHTSTGRIFPEERYMEIGRSPRESRETSPRCDVCVRTLEGRYVRMLGAKANERRLCDMCGEFVSAACICRMDGLIDLCPDCYRHMGMMPEGQVKSSIKHILIGNVL